MDQLRKQVARARRRLVIEQFLGRLIWCTLVAFSLAAIAIAAPRVFVIPGLPENWDSIWLIGAFPSASLFAIGWTIVSNRSPIDAAIEIDRRFDLRERVASSLSLSPDDQTTEAGRAVVNDALRAVERIDVDDKFRVQIGRRAWWPLVPATAVFMLVAFFDNREASSTTDPAATAQTAEQTKNALESLRKKFEEQRKQAKAEGLKNAEELFKELEQGTRELSQKDKIDSAKTHVKLNDLTRQLEERRKQLGGDEALKEQLQKMKDMGAGPADKAAQAMKQGEWNKALQEIDKLAKNIKDGKLSKEEKEQLAKQLEKMKDKLAAAAEAHKQAMGDLKKQIEQQKKDGNLAKAGELQQKLDQMQKQQAQMDRMQKLAQQMAQAQQALQQGNNQKAADAMAQMAQQLDQMQKEMGEMKMLDAQMDQFQMAKDAMACKECKGEGCQECQGNQFAMKGGKNPNGKPGRGMGEGVGIGNRPEEKDKTNTRESQVKQKQRRGSATVEGLAEGPNIRGDVAQTIKEEMAASAAEPADPLTSDRLPQSRREQAKQYFEILGQGK